MKGEKSSLPAQSRERDTARKSERERVTRGAGGETRRTGVARECRSVFSAAYTRCLPNA